MELLQSLLLGFTQGITEFLPISSSGHLVAIPYLLGWKYNGLSFDVALHFGTFLALLFFFWRDWFLIIKEGLLFLFRKNELSLPSTALPRNLLWQIALATIPAAITGLFLDNYIESHLHSPLMLAINLAVFGLILWLTDKLAKKDLSMAKINFKHSFLIGLLQSLALIPGVSRAGITMVAGRAIGLDREKAARFSFLLAMPAMLGAFLFKAGDMTVSDINAIFAIGVISSAVFGILAIRFLLNFLKKSDFSVFVYYRFLLALILLITFLIR